MHEMQLSAAILALLIHADESTDSASEFSVSMMVLEQERPILVCHVQLLVLEESMRNGRLPSSTGAYLNQISLTSTDPLLHMRRLESAKAGQC
jgi:hypothetical protein